MRISFNSRRFLEEMEEYAPIPIYDAYSATMYLHIIDDGDIVYTMGEHYYGIFNSEKDAIQYIKKQYDDMTDDEFNELITMCCDIIPVHSNTPLNIYDINNTSVDEFVHYIAKGA